MRRADQYLAGDTGLRHGAGCGSCAVLCQREDGNPGAMDGQAHADPIAGPRHSPGSGGPDLFKADIGDGKGFGHPVRRVQ